jgi:hypothetical protein
MPTKAFKEYYDYEICGRVAHTFDLASFTNRGGCPVLRGFCEGRESGMPAQVCWSTSGSKNQIAHAALLTHPCKERKDGAPSVEALRGRFREGVTPTGLSGSYELKSKFPP